MGHDIFGAMTVATPRHALCGVEAGSLSGAGPKIE